MSRVKVGHVLELQRRPVEIEPSDEYVLVGVYSFGKGIFHRNPQLGVDLGDYKFSEVAPGDLVVSNIQAWEGAIGHATNVDRNTIGTHRFLCYTARDEAEIDTNWARYYFLSPAGFPQIQAAAPGSVTRNRTLARERFEAIEIPLPDIEEQRRIAAHLDCVAGIVNHLEDRLAEQDLHPAATLLPGLVDRVLEIASEERVEAGALYEVVSDVVHPGDPYEGAECFIGLQHIESHTGQCLGSDPLGDEKGRKFRFQPGDVVYGYLRPYLNKVWVADRVGLCSVDQYVLRPKEGVEPRLLAYVLRSGGTLAQAEQLTHNLQLPRLRTKLLKGIVGADPRSMDAKVLSRLDRLTVQMLQLARAQARRHRLATAVLPAALNRKFAELV